MSKKESYSLETRMLDKSKETEKNMLQEMFNLETRFAKELENYIWTTTFEEESVRKHKLLQD